MIRESYNFKALRKLIITRRPDNIPSLKQIFGRGIRTGSHSLLPPEKRTIDIAILSSCLPTKTNGKYDLSHEEKKYREKMGHYKTIQEIEKIFHMNAIDALINQGAINPKKTIKDPLGNFNILFQFSVISRF